jgi:hypothetical protein
MDKRQLQMFGVNVSKTSTQLLSFHEQNNPNNRLNYLSLFTTEPD